MVEQITGGYNRFRGPCGSHLMLLSTIDTEAQAMAGCRWRRALVSLSTSMGLSQHAMSAIALTQGQAAWKTKTLVAKMRAIGSHLKTGYITVSYTDTTNMVAVTLAELLDPSPAREASVSLGGIQFDQQTGTSPPRVERSSWLRHY